jgi:acetyltransferase AlgX (SGNH hydrolase-like protein)
MQHQTPYRRCNVVLIGLALLSAGITLAVALWLQPLVGDLTRLGGYSENDFGWNGTEALFAPPLAHSGFSGHEDIVVLGDSFSMRNTSSRQTQAGGFWTDFLAADTGLSVGVFDADKMTVERLLDNEAFRRDPPSLVILEIVERNLRNRLGGGPASCDVDGPAATITIQGQPVKQLPDSILRATRQRLTSKSIDSAVDYLRQTLLRWILPHGPSQVLRLKLSRQGLFSSRRQDVMLAYADDREKASWSPTDWAAIRCRLITYQHGVEANGRTRFAFVMVPDKSWAYAPYLPDYPWQIDAVAHLSLDDSINMPRVDLALRSAIRAGARDVYLPNDTHWGSAGSRIAAQVVSRYLHQPVLVSAHDD